MFPSCTIVRMSTSKNYLEVSWRSTARKRPSRWIISKCKDNWVSVRMPVYTGNVSRPPLHRWTQMSSFKQQKIGATDKNRNEKECSYVFIHGTGIIRSRDQGQVVLGDWPFIGSRGTSTQKADLKLYCRPINVTPCPVSRRTRESERLACYIGSLQQCQQDDGQTFAL